MSRQAAYSGRVIAAGLLCFALISAAPNTPPDDLIRQGSKAIEKGEFETALQLFQDAEERGTDPGLIAFNKASAYWHLGEFRKAENHYRMSLDDAAAPTERRARAFYNLANSLVKQAEERDYRLLREAIRDYEFCLELVVDNELRGQAKHNLELAKILWHKARASSSNPPSPNDDQRDTPRQPEAKKKLEKEKKTDSAVSDNGKDPKKEIDSKTKVEKGTNVEDQKSDPNMTDTPQPGPGRVPVIPDRDELQPLETKDVENALAATEYRLNKIRERLRAQATTPEKPSGKDW